MLQGKRLWLVASILVFVLISIGTFSFLSKPQTIDLASPTATKIESVVTQLYQLQGTLICEPDTNVDVLDEVLLDTADYRPSLREINTIKIVYGVGAVIQAGYLTSQKAYYLSRRSPAPVTPEQG